MQAGCFLLTWHKTWHAAFLRENELRLNGAGGHMDTGGGVEEQDDSKG